MSVNKNTSKQLIESRLMLESDLNDGALGVIFGQSIAHLKKFGTILQDSAKLIGGDIGYLVKLTFGRLRSLKDYQNMKKDNNRRRKDLIRNISKNSDELMDAWPDGKITSMMIAPGAFFTTSALTGLGKITSKEFREEIGRYGFDQIPVLDRLFGTESDGGYQLLKDISRCEPGDNECMSRALSLGAAAASSGPTSRSTSKLSSLATKINSIFLFANHEIVGTILQEGEESSGESPDLTEEQYSAYVARVKEEINKDLLDARNKWVEAQKKYFDKIVGEAEKVINLNTNLASTEDSAEFFGILEKLKKVAGEDMKDFDIEKIKSTFQEIGEKFKSDEESMSKLQKSMEEEKIEETEENISKKLEKIVLSSFKGTFLQELRSTLTDYYEEVYTIITGGISDDHMKILRKDDLGKEYLSMVNSYENKLKDALSNLK